MNSSKLDNHSKNSAFKKFKRLSYNYFPKFVKTYKNESNFSSNRLDINQFLIIFYDCVPNVSQFLSIDKLLENCNILQVRYKNPVTALYRTTKPEVFFEETNTI